MQLNCSYLSIELYSINYYVAVVALLQFSVDKVINFYASDDVIYCLLSEVFDL